jgi:ubiquinone/menaquinone biosynthesis C-methylase UbiE
MPTARDHDRVRESYDEVAHEYAARFGSELVSKPLDRALLAALIELTERGAPIADLGCGPGHVAAWLADHGRPAVGIDLSPEMIATGRREHPQVEFREGDLFSLPATAGEFGSAIALYSIIHLEPSELHLAFDEIGRTLRPSGRLLVAFHVGSEVRHLADWWGHEVDIDFRFFETAGVVQVLEDAGFVEEARLERANYPEEVETRRAYVLARRVRGPEERGDAS